VTDNALYVEKHSPEVKLTYLSAALRFADFNQYAGRAAQPLISGSRIYPVSILVPPIDLQYKFAKHLQAAERLEATQEASQTKLDALFASLQHRAFRGEL
jgi:type I restriction enzyme S subunit